LPNRGGIGKMATRRSFSVNSRNRYFVFIATAENPVSHKSVVTKGSKTFIALSDKLGWTSSTTAKTEDVHLHETRLQMNYHRMCMSFSC
jgi:hypothetical protein